MRRSASTKRSMRGTPTTAIKETALGELRDTIAATVTLPVQQPAKWKKIIGIAFASLITVGGFGLSIINTYWIHFRKDERLSVTIMDVGVSDPTPTNSFFTVDAVFANKGNLPAVITSCTLSLSDKQDMSSRTYLVWSEPDALMMPPQDLKVRQLKYGEQVFSLGIKEWGTNVAVNARL